MSDENHVAVNVTESVDYNNVPKEESGLINTKNLNNTGKCETSGEMSSEKALNKECESITKEASNLKENIVNSKNKVHSSVNEIENFNDNGSTKLEGSNISNTLSTELVCKSLSDKDMSTLETKSSQSKNDLNGKDFTDTSITNNSDTVEDHKIVMKLGALKDSYDNSKDDVQLDSVKPFYKNDESTLKNLQVESDKANVTHFESNKLPQCNDTSTGDLLVGKRKRENAADENVRKKQLKTETKEEESTNNQSKSNSEQTIAMESNVLDELEKEIFDDEEISEPQDEESVMKDLTVKSSEKLLKQAKEANPEPEPNNKEIGKGNQGEYHGNKSEPLSHNVKETPENMNLSSKNISMSKNSSVTNSEKDALENKFKNGESLKELNGESTAENVKDIECAMNKLEDKNLDTSGEVNNEPENKLTTNIPISERNTEEKTLKTMENISEHSILEKDTDVPKKDLENGSSQEEEEEEEETKMEVEPQSGSENIVSSFEEKKNEESSELPECTSNNEIKGKEILPSESFKTSNEELFTNDTEEDSSHSNSKDVEENVTDIVISEAFSINEEEMKAMDSAMDDDDDNDNSEKSVVEKYKSSQKKQDVSISTPSVSSVGSPALSIDHDKPARKKTPSKPGKKYKRSSHFGAGKKKKKTSGLPKVAATPYVPPAKLELDLPSFLQDLATIDPTLDVVRDRYDEDGKKLKVHCIVFHETVLDWAMSETLLSAMDNSKALRTRLKVKTRSHLFPENYDSTLNEIHPVLIGDVFPFAMPRVQTEESVSDKEEVPLPLPLEQLCSLCPSALGYRTAGKEKKLNLKSVSFADEPLEWAFKETFLSSFDDSPILSNIFELDSSSKSWPDFADVILTHEGVSYTFPFACPNSKKYMENFLFSNLSPNVPVSLGHETLQLPSIRPDLERDLNGERDSLVRLLAVASFYKHSSCIPAIRTNRKLSVSHAALVSSFRPLIISQANKTGKLLRDIRADLLKDVTCQDPSIIPSMINGPLHCKRGIIFSHLQRLEAAVAKDPNNKLQNI